MATRTPEDGPGHQATGACLPAWCSAGGLSLVEEGSFPGVSVHPERLTKGLGEEQCWKTYSDISLKHKQSYHTVEILYYK